MTTNVFVRFSESLIGLGAIGILLLTLYGCSSAGSANNPAPTAPMIIVASVSPNSGAVGTPVMITGTNFGTTQGSSTVAFNGTASAATSWNSTSIAATVPAGATTGNVVVTVGGQASNGVTFTVTTSAPTISTVSPNSAAVGTPVTITGTNFGAAQGSSTVTFNGTAATATSWNSTSIAATVPAGATTGNVVVTVGGQASNGVTFTVTASAPTISTVSGGAPAADSSGNLYLLTGNGVFDANTNGSNYGDSTLKLSTTSGLSVADWFTPMDQASLDSGDVDHGAGGAAILVDQPSATYPHLVIGGGKAGVLFLMNRDNLGHFSSSTNNVLQQLGVGPNIYATAAFWNNSLYIAAAFDTPPSPSSGGPMKHYSFDTTTEQFSAGSQTSLVYNFPGPTPSASSNGSVQGVVWALDNSKYCTPGANSGCGPAVLHAYDATNLATELWNSSQAAGDQAGNAVKFTVPTVANGKVYVGTRGNNTGGIFGSSSVSGELDVYGLKPN